MATVAQIRADLVGSSASFRAAMVDGQRQANTSLTAIQIDAKRAADSIRDLGNTARAFVGFEAIRRGVGDLIDAQKQIQAIHYSLLSATGSSSQADQAYAAVSKTANQLGLDLQTSAQGFAQLSAAASANGIAMADQQHLFDGVAKSATVLHLSSEATGRAILALSQMMSKGRIQAEELRQQLGDAIPGVVPRFQAAVLEMTKGTDLAGKSFDQLLQAGDLTVQRFLPALTQALNATGRGAEQASSGLNAEMNRLSTAWFKLKADLSGGLFSDAATASVRAMAENLDRLATGAGIAGGVVVARIAGAGASKVASGASALVQQQQEARAAAVAAGELAQAHVSAAAAEVRSNEAALAGVTTARQQAFAQREAAQALYQKALAENEAAQATLAHQANAAGLSANYRAQRIAAADAAVAQANLNRAQAQYDGAIAGGNALKQQQIVLETRLIEARAASAAAAEAQAVAEAELAATSTRGLLARGAAGLGNFALSLVGGPWGAAIAAAGAMGYAIYELSRKGEEYRHETDEQVKSLQQLREQLQGAAKDYGALQGKTSLSQGIDLYRSSVDTLSKQRGELADLQAQADKLRQSISARAGTQGGVGNAIADGFDERKLALVTDRIRDLEAQLGPTTTAANELGAKLAGSMAPAIDAVKGAVDRLRSGGSIADVFEGWSADITKGIAAVDQARQKTSDDMSALANAAKGWQKQADEVGKTPGQIARAQLDNIIKDIRAQRLDGAATAKAIEDARKDSAPHLKAADDATAAAQAKKNAEAAASAAKQQAAAYATVQRQIQDRMDQDHAAVDSNAKLTDAERLRVTVLNDISSAHLKLSPTEEKHVRAMLDEAVAAGQARVADEQLRASMALTQATRERINSSLQTRREQNAIDVAGVGHGQQQVRQMQDELRIRQQYQRNIDDLNRDANKPSNLGTINGIGGTGYLERLGELQRGQQEELALYRDGVDQRLAAEADWKNGAKAAYEDYLNNAADVAGQTYTLFTDAFSSMGDAISNFVTTGKLDFKGFVVSVLQDLAKMEARIFASQILMSIVGGFTGGGGSVQGLGGSASSYSGIGSGGSFSGAFDFASASGGRANGGPVAAGGLYEVAEGGRPELLQSGGRTYLMTGESQGHVTQAAGATTGSGDAPSVNITINVNAADGSDDTSGVSEAPAWATKMARTMKDAARQAIAEEQRTGGMLWKGRNK